MHGNVWDWCQNEVEPGVDRVIRGGSWRIMGRHCRSSARRRYEPDIRSIILGFRCVRVQV